MTVLGQALRRIRKSPAFAITAIITFAVAIGLNSAVFALTYDLYFRSLPFAHPEQLVRLFGEAKDRDLKKLPFSIPRFWHYRDGQTVFTGIAADAGASFVLTGIGAPEQINGGSVTANYFEVLGVKPVLGRLFSREEEEAADVVLVSTPFWKSRLGADPNVIGRVINLNGVPNTIIGVLPRMPVSWWGRRLDIWNAKPFQPVGHSREFLMRGAGFLRVIGRLKAGVTPAGALSHLIALQSSYAVANPEKADTRWIPTLLAATEDAVGDLRATVVTLCASVALVLLIACSNIAGLFLTRFAAAGHDAAVRIALGASRLDIFRLTLSEACVVTGVGSGLGVMLAATAIPAIVRLAPDSVPLDHPSALSSPVLLLTIGAAALTAFATGLYSGLQLWRAGLATHLQNHSKLMVSRRQGRATYRLVSIQIAIAVVVVASAASLTSSLIKLMREPTGIRSAGVWTGGLELPMTHYPDASARQHVVNALLQQLRATGGVDAAAVSDTLPLTGGHAFAAYARDDRSELVVAERPIGLIHAVTPEYFKTLGVPLLQGRDFNEGDQSASLPVTIVSSSTAKRLYPSDNAIGKTLLIGTDNGTGLPVQIIGIAGDISGLSIGEVDAVEFYRPLTQRDNPSLSISLHSTFSGEQAGAIVRAALQHVDPNLPLIGVATMNELAAESIGEQRTRATLLCVFAAVAIGLAAVGIYGVIASGVQQRVGEIGLRVALGAEWSDILRLVMTLAMQPIIVGSAAGAVIAAAIGRVVASHFYRLGSFDPLVLCCAVATISLPILLAAVLPALRALRIDPVEALRSQ